MEKNQPLCERCGKEVCGLVDMSHEILPNYDTKKHARETCHGSCQKTSGKPRKNYAEAMAILKSMDPTKPGRCGRCQKCDSGGSCGRGGEGSSGVSLLSPSAPTPTKDICASCNGPMVEDRRGGYLGGVMCLSEKCPAGQPPTPGEVGEMRVGFDPAVFGQETARLAISVQEGDVTHVLAVLYGYHAEIVNSLLSSHASKAREEGRKEGAEEQYRKDVEATKQVINEEAFYTKVVDCSVVPAHLIDNALSQTNPKKE